MRHTHHPHPEADDNDHHHDHAEHQGHDHTHVVDAASCYRPGVRGRLLASIVITGAMMVVELVGGLLSNSLALVSDAGHMFTHFFALALSLSAIVVACRPSTDVRTYGFYRAEILAAFVNGLVLMGATLYIVYEAVVRFLAPRPVATTEMLWVAAAGLAVNMVSAGLLWKVGHEDINVRSAFMHMMGDLLSSVAVVGGAVAIRYTGWSQIDPALGVLISVLIGIWSWRLLRDSANVLLEAVPRHLHGEDLPAAMCAGFPEVLGVHDVHVWEITTSMYAMTAHVAVAANTPVSGLEELRERLHRFVAERFRIGHAIFQFEGPEELESINHHRSGIAPPGSH